MTVIPNLIILSLPLSFLRKEGLHQNNIVSQHSNRELFSSTQDLRCKIKLIIFWFHAVIDHYDNGSKLDLDLPVTAPQSEFPYSSKYTNLIPELYRAMIDSNITCSRIVLFRWKKWNRLSYTYLKSPKLKSVIPLFSASSFLVDDLLFCFDILNFW